MCGHPLFLDSFTHTPTLILRTTKNSGFWMDRNRRPVVYKIFSSCTSGSCQGCLGEYSMSRLSEYPGGLLPVRRGVLYKGDLCVLGPHGLLSSQQIQIPA